METLSYSDFSLKLHDKTLAQRIPASGLIEVTRRCPMNCVHCYNNLPMGDEEAREKELTYEEHCRILNEMTEAGCLWLLYTGGEVFVREDFLDIYTYAKKKGLLITLFTNGAFITPEIADYLTEWRPFSIEITLYGRTKETHEKITRTRGSYETCIQAIQLLMDRNLPLKLKTMAITTNKHELWEMKQFVEEDLGLEFRFDGMINPRLDCSLGPLEVRLSPKEIAEFDLQDPKRMTEWKRFCEIFKKPFDSQKDYDRLYQCGAGLTSFAIDPTGMLSVCGLSYSNAFDLRKGSFQEGWDQFLSEVLKKRISRLTKCVPCEIKAMCGMCPANAELENGDPEEPVDFLCQVAHLRAKAFGLNIKPHGDCKYCNKLEQSLVSEQTEII